MQRCAQLLRAHHGASWPASPFSVEVRRMGCRPPRARFRSTLQDRVCRELAASALAPRAALRSSLQGVSHHSCGALSLAAVGGSAIRCRAEFGGGRVGKCGHGCQDSSLSHGGVSRHCIASGRPSLVGVVMCSELASPIPQVLRTIVPFTSGCSLGHTGVSKARVGIGRTCLLPRLTTFGRRRHCRQALPHMFVHAYLGRRPRDPCIHQSRL